MTRLPALLASRGAATAAPDARLDLSALLDAVEAAPPAEGVDALAAELAARVSASEVSMLIADISGRTLARLARRPAPGRGLPLRPARAHVEIDGTPAGTALTTQRIHVSRDEDGMRVHIPVSERGEAVGVLPPSSSSTGTARPAQTAQSRRSSRSCASTLVTAARRRR